MSKNSPQLFVDTIDQVLGDHPLERVYFPSHTLPPPPLAFSVNFPRISIVLEGCYEMEVEKHGLPTVIRPEAGSVVVLAPNHWNKPTWSEPVKVLSVLFGKKRTGLSLVSADQTGLSGEARKYSFERQIEEPISWVLKSVMELASNKAIQETVCQLINGLLLLLRDQLQSEERPVRSKAAIRYDDICLYLQENFHHNITRDSVADEFSLSPSHLSRIFSEGGNMRFSEYLTCIRVDRSKYLLKNYDIKLDEIASCCGYVDTAYFCRIFKGFTKITPSEYRLRARSQDY